MSVREVQPELLQKARDELNEDPERRAADIAALRDWLQEQSHIVAKPDDQMLITFLRGCKFNLERAKEKFNKFYTLRTASPEYFSNRNLKDPSMESLIKSISVLPLPQVDPHGRRIVLIRTGAIDSSAHSIQEYMKMCFMYMEMWLWEDDAFVISGPIVLVDLKNASFSFFIQFTPSVAKRVFAIAEASPLRPQIMIFINTPVIIRPIIYLAKSFAKEKLWKRMHLYYGPNIDDVHHHIPKECLPAEYGGSLQGTLQEINDTWWRERKRDYCKWFLGPEGSAGVDESKRPVKPSTGYSFLSFFRS